MIEELPPPIARKSDGRRKSQTVHIKAIRRKELDYDAIAYVYYVMAKREVERRRKEGLPRPERTPEQQAELEKAIPELAKLRKDLERMQAKLRDLGIDPDEDETKAA